MHWLQQGAQPTEQVAKILDFAGVWDAFKSATGKDAAAKPTPRTPKAKSREAREERAGRAAARRPPSAEAPSAEATARRPRPMSERRRRTSSNDDDTYEDDEELEDDDDYDDEIAPEGNRAAGGRAKAVVEHVARHLVDDPEGVFVDANERRDTVTLLIHASPGDMGRIIGKRGRVIQALRQVGRGRRVRPKACGSPSTSRSRRTAPCCASKSGGVAKAHGLHGRGRGRADHEPARSLRAGRRARGSATAAR